MAPTFTIVAAVLLVVVSGAHPRYGKDKEMGEIGEAHARTVINAADGKTTGEEGGMDGTQESGGCKNRDDQTINPAICDDLERQLGATEANPVLLGLFIFINTPLSITRSLLEDTFAMVRMGKELEENAFEEIADVLESELKRTCGLALPEVDRASLLSFGDGLDILFGEEGVVEEEDEREEEEDETEEEEEAKQDGMKKKSGFRINSGNRRRQYKQEH